MHPRIIWLFTAAIACSTAETRGEPDTASPTPAAPVVVTLNQFKELQWLAGSWRGSGGAYPAFYEEYRVVDDSTMQMRGLSDSTFSVATDSAWIEFRNGEVRKRGVDREYVVVALAADSIRFATPGSTQGGHTFTRTSSDEWTATLHPGAPGGQATVYVMRRVQR